VFSVEGKAMNYLPDDPVILNNNETAILAIDQRKLPRSEEHLTLSSAAETAEAIRTLAVRGAPCIGICAGYGVYISARNHSAETAEAFLYHTREDATVIETARPTAVNLSWAVNRMMKVLDQNASLTPHEITEKLKTEAIRIHEEDIDICRRIAENGLKLIKDGASVITHCNAGALATSRYGTGLGPLLLGAQKGMHFHAYVDETRPLLQGARLTAYELSKAGIETTLMCDNMAAYLMSQGKIDACVVGCDRVAANGDTANKIGTSGLAIIAKHFGVPFYVFCPTPTIDKCCKSGKDIRIEQRKGDEITTMHFSQPIAPEGISCLNPAFDVTPASLITAIITENGITRPPFDFS